MRGSIRKRGRTWTYVLDLGQDTGGRRRQKWVGGFATKRQAESALTEVLERVRTGGYRDAGRTTVAEYLEQWLTGHAPAVRLTTAKSYANTLRHHVIPRIGHLRLTALEPRHVSTLIADLLATGRMLGEGGLSPRSVQYAHKILSHALSDAVKWGLLSRNPAALVDSPRVPRKEMQVWTPEQVRAFLGLVNGDRLFAMWMLFVSTGMRRGEVLGLRWADIDFDRGRLAVRQNLVEVEYELVMSEPKTAKSRRVVSLDPYTVNVLAGHRQAQLTECRALGVVSDERWAQLVFTQPDGRPCQPQNVSQAFENIVRRSGLPQIRLHDLRHTAATVALNVGIHPKVVSERLGHANIGITLDTYSHVVQGLQDAAAVELGRAIFKEEPASSVVVPLSSHGGSTG